MNGLQPIIWRKNIHLKNHTLKVRLLSVYFVILFYINLLHVTAILAFLDFESQFRFHEPCDFPEPETSPVSTDKTYPSELIKTKKNRTSKKIIKHL